MSDNDFHRAVADVSAIDPGAERATTGRGAATEGQLSPEEDLREDVRFGALRNALYHSSRRGFLETAHKLFQFVTIFGGAGVISALGHDFPQIGVASAILMALATAIDMSWDPRGQAIASAGLCRRYYGLLADADGADLIGLRRLASDMTRLYAEESPQLRAVDAIAHNAAADILWGDSRKRLRIRWYQSLFRHLYAFNGTRFPEIPARETGTDAGR